MSRQRRTIQRFGKLQERTGGVTRVQTQTLQEKGFWMLGCMQMPAHHPHPALSDSQIPTLQTRGSSIQFMSASKEIIYMAQGDKAAKPTDNNKQKNVSFFIKTIYFSFAASYFEHVFKPPCGSATWLWPPTAANLSVCELA